MKKNIKILFLGKDKDTHCLKALSLLQRNFETVTATFGKWGDPFPQELKEWEGDYVISYLSRWIIPDSLLKRAKKGAINFHPAPPSYPGVGCNNFALYDGVKEFGVTCHHMNPSVDTGSVIAVKRFPVYESDDVESMLSRTYDNQLALFYEIFHHLYNDEPLPTSDEKWTRKPFTRTELNKLSIIDSSMSNDEVRRRVRATTFKMFRPEVLIGDYKFVLEDTEDSPS